MIRPSSAIATTDLRKHEQWMTRNRGRVKRNACLVTLGSCVGAALTADHGQQTCENLVTNSQLIEPLPSDAARVLRTTRSRCSVLSEALSPGFRFSRRLHEHPAGPWGQ